MSQNGPGMEGKQLWGKGQGTFRGQLMAGEAWNRRELKAGQAAGAGELDGYERMLAVGTAEFRSHRLKKGVEPQGIAVAIPSV